MAEGCPLTPKQLEIIEKLADGKTANQIAKSQGRSRNTVNRHISLAFDRTGAPNTPALVAVSIRNGWIK